MTEKVDEYYQMAEMLLTQIKNAQDPYGMQLEFLSFFLRDLGITMDQFHAAVWFAVCEWDL